MPTKTEKGWQCSFCDYQPQEDTPQAAFNRVRAHERKECPMRQGNQPPKETPKGGTGGGSSAPAPAARKQEDLSEVAGTLAGILAEHAPDIRETSRRALLRDFDGQPQIRTREQLQKWLDEDYRDVLSAGQIHRISRAMFPATAEAQASETSGFKTVNTPWGPMMMFAPQAGPAQPQMPYMMPAPSKPEPDPAMEKRLDKLETALEKVAEAIAENRNAGPLMRKRMTPKIGPDGEMVLNRRTGEPEVEIIEEPYDPQDAGLERFMRLAKLFKPEGPAPGATTAEDIRRAAREAMEPLQDQVKALTGKIELDRAKNDAQEEVRAREVRPLEKKIEELRDELQETRGKAGLPAEVQARMVQQDRVLERADRVFAQAAEYINMQNLRQMGVDPDRLAELYRARREKGQTTEDDFSALSRKVRT